MEDNLLNGWEAIAKFLRVSEPTARKLAQKHSMPVARFDDTILTTENVLLKWVIKNMINIARET